MIMKVGVYFPPELPISAKRLELFRQAGVKLVPFDWNNFSKSEFFFLAAPILIAEKNEYVNPELVWFRYLSANFPDLKMIRTGLFKTNIRHGILDWLDLNLDIHNFLMSAPHVTSLPFQHIGTSKTLTSVWRSFWDGHNRGGFNFHFIDLKNELTGLIHIIEKIKNGQANFSMLENILQEVIILARKVMSGWETYFPYWQSTPFFESFTRINLILRTLPYNWTVADVFNRLEPLQGQMEYVDRALNLIFPYFQNDEDL